MTGLDHGSHDEFTQHYAKQSLSESSIQRMQGIVDCCVRWLDKKNASASALQVADIACNTGELGRIWAMKGHKVYGIDINQPLLDIAKERALSNRVEIEYILGSAANLPWSDQSMDVCVVPELLEHVVEWGDCIKEFIRILKPNGILYVSTTNRLCPIQQEFDLPLYSWYPKFIKHYFEKLAVTTHPKIAGYAKYPAVNWFTYYQLRDYLRIRGLSVFDRFDIMDVEGKAEYQKIIINFIKKSTLLRCLGHIATPHLIIIAVKNA